MLSQSAILSRCRTHELVLNINRAMRAALLLVLLFPLPLLSAGPASLPQINADLIAGRADDAISHLQSSLAASPNDAEAHNLLCRVYYQEERWDDAIKECEAAVKLSSS